VVFQNKNVISNNYAAGSVLCRRPKEVGVAFYIRKSVSFGPIRFNLSKSGVGASVGVTGFRVGVRPNGKSYLHAGRYGLYAREELDGRGKDTQLPPGYERHEVGDDGVVEYTSASTEDLIPKSREELLKN